MEGILASAMLCRTIREFCDSALKGVLSDFNSLDGNFSTQSRKMRLRDEQEAKRALSHFVQ